MSLKEKVNKSKNFVFSRGRKSFFWEIAAYGLVAALNFGSGYALFGCGDDGNGNSGDESCIPSGLTGEIAFTSQIDGNYEIYVMNADGSCQTNLTNSPASDQHPAWSE